VGQGCLFPRRGTMTSHTRSSTPYPPSETLQSADMRNPWPIVGRREHMNNRGSTGRLNIERPFVPVRLAGRFCHRCRRYWLERCVSEWSTTENDEVHDRQTFGWRSEWELKDRVLSATEFVNVVACNSVGKRCALNASSILKYSTRRCVASPNVTPPVRTSSLSTRRTNAPRCATGPR
jgi:hypothetical protein